MQTRKTERPEKDEIRFSKTGNPEVCSMRPEIRRDYIKGKPLLESEAGDDPIALFQTWFSEAEKIEIDANAMTLATADSSGHPSARVVLLKGIESGTFVFFTHYNSKKGKDLEVNPFACLNFFWSSLERQVRISGSVERIAPGQSTEYFQSRPRESQIGAHASHQSSRISSREELEQRFLKLKESFDQKIPRPETWGGYGLNPVEIEFWQGRSNRLHDRILFQKSESGWDVSRLSP